MKLKRYIDYIIERFLIILMGIMTIDVLWKVFSRYALEASSQFADELAVYLLMWIAVIGAAYVAGKKQHLAIDILPNKAKPPFDKILHYVIHGLILFFAISVLIIGGINLVSTTELTGQTSAVMNISLSYVYICLPLSGLLIVYYSLFHIITGDFGRKSARSSAAV